MSEESLIDAVDRTARALLRKIESGDNADEAASKLFIEQVKCFEAVARWTKERVDLGPQLPVSESKFAGLKRQFNPAGAEAKRRGSGAAPETESGADAPAAEPRRRTSAVAATGKTDSKPLAS